MQTIDVFSSLGAHFIDDPRVQRYGTVFASHGRKGVKKPNLAAAWLDAGIAVCEACNSYLQYAVQKEINKQLEIENMLLRTELDAQLKKLSLNYILALAEQENRQTSLSQHIERMSHENHILLEEIRQYKTLVFRMHKLVIKQRQYSNSCHLQKLQTALDKQLHATLLCLMSVTE